MIYIIVGVLLLLCVGGILAYALGLAVSGVGSTMTGWMPALGADPYFILATSLWIWMPLLIIVVAVAWETTNGQLRRSGE